MSLTKPILSSVVPFDATKEYSFLFNVIGGDQVVKNVLTIINNSTGIEVYSSENITFQFKNTIPQNTLLNGTYYSATLVTYNSANDVSPVSNIIQFYCFSTPTIIPYNFTSGGTIENQSFNFAVEYQQLESEPLNSYTFDLYNSSHIKIATSGILFSSVITVPLIFYYLFNGFSNNTLYYIECSGLTLNGVSVNSGQIPFIASYIAPQTYSLITLSNNCDEGYVVIGSNIQNIIGTSNPYPPVYLTNSEVDLTSVSSYVLWNSGYIINTDFTIRLWGRKFSPNTLIFNQRNTSPQQYFSIYYRTGYEPNSSTLKAYVDMIVSDVNNTNGDAYYIFSNYIDIPLETEQISIWVRKVNNIYEIIVENKGVV